MKKYGLIISIGVLSLLGCKQNQPNKTNEDHSVVPTEAEAFQSSENQDFEDIENDDLPSEGIESISTIKVSTEVVSSGSLHDLMQGNLKATISLKDFAKTPHLYAVGALENLKGEVQIFDGKSLVSRKSDEMVLIDKTFNSSAALLVYAVVEEWQEIKIPSMIKSHKQFEIFVQQAAEKAGLDTTKPFPFLLSGDILKLDWHIVFWDENNTNHTEQSHVNSGLNGVLANGEVEILGFYSQNHEGVFTHKGQKTHMHFHTKSTKLAGHVDSIFLGAYMTLKLPK